MYWIIVGLRSQNVMKVRNPSEYYNIINLTLNIAVNSKNTA